MNKTPVQKLSHYAGIAGLIAFYIALTAYVMYFSFSSVFPENDYRDYLFPAFGVLFAIAAGNDISNLKTDIEIKYKRRNRQ